MKPEDSAKLPYLPGTLETVEFSVGLSCRNLCIFCAEHDLVESSAIEPIATMPDFRQRLAPLSPETPLRFGGREPLSNPLLPEFISWAYAKGFRRIGLISAGRELATAGMLEKLRDAGLTQLEISLHGATAKTHDALTQVPGSFDETVAALYRVHALRQSGWKLRFSVQVAITKSNLPELGSIIGFLESFQPNTVVLSPLQYVGRACKHLDVLPFRYSELVGLVGTWNPASFKVPIRYLKLPPCIAIQLPPKLVGSHNRITFINRVQSGVDLSAIRLVKGEPCRDCPCNSVCQGVEPLYVERFGWDEFRPVDEEEWKTFVSQTEIVEEEKAPEPMLRHEELRRLFGPFADPKGVAGWTYAEEQILNTLAHVTFRHTSGLELKVFVTRRDNGAEENQGKRFALCFDGQQRVPKRAEAFWHALVKAFRLLDR